MRQGSETATQPVPRTAEELVERLESRGVRMRAQGDSLVLDAPRDALGDQDRAQIRALKPAVLDYLRARAEAVGSGAPQRIPRLPRGEPLPLGLVQQRMWLLDHLDRGSTVNNLPGAWRLAGRLDVAAFAGAIGEIFRRHEILRTRIVTSDGEPRQIADDDFRPELPVIDLRPVPDASRHDEMMRLVRELRDTPFDLSQLPLVRMRLYRLGDDEHVFFLLPHHVVWDGWSWDVFFDELAALYVAFEADAPSPLPPLGAQYADYAVWHRALMSGPELERQIDYWRSTLSGDLPTLQLPADRARPAELSQRGERRLLDLDAELIARLRAIGREEHATLFMVLLAAYAAWLSRATGQTELVIGVPTQDRLRQEADRMIGVLVNTLPLRIRVPGGSTFRELLRQVRDAAVQAYDHQDVPFDRLVEELGVKRSGGHTPLYQTLFTFQDVTTRPRRIGSLEMSQVHVDTGTAPTDLLFACMIAEERSVALLDFNADLFDASSMNRMSASLATLLRDVAADSGRDVARLSVISEPGASARAQNDPRLFAPGAAPSASGPTPLTHGQEGMWFVERATPGTTVHNLATAARLTGPLDGAALEAALRHVNQRHETLRYRVRDEHGVPVTHIADDGGLELQTATLARGADAEARLGALLDSHAAEPFDLERGPLWRALFVRTGDDEHVLQIVFHHLTAYERSIAKILRDIGVAYRALRAGEQPDSTPLSRTFADFAAESRRRLDSPELRAQLDYWSGRLTTLAPPLVLGDRTGSVVPSLRGASIPFVLDAEASRAIDDFAARHDVSPLAIVLAALRAVLHAHSGERLTAVGVPVTIRPDGPEWDDVAGPFMNTVVIQSDFDPERSFAEQIAIEQRATLEAAANSEIPFSRVVEQVRPSRTLRSPLFQVLLSVEEHASARLDLDGTRAEMLFRQRTGIETDIAIYLERNDVWSGRIDFATDLFERQSVERLGSHLRNALAAIAADGAMAATGLLSESERAELVALSDGPPMDLADATVVDAIARRSLDQPGRVVIGFRDATTTGEELWSRAGSVARGLAERGVGRGGTVGICLERSPDILVAMIGAWRAGAAYLPLDPDFPSARLQFMLEDSAAALVLCDERGADALPDGATPRARLADVEAAGAAAASVRLQHPHGDDQAYVIYTSGSTGRPKGVQVDHRALLNFIAAMAERPGLEADDVLLAVTTLSFDISALELLLPLWTGARLVIADEEEARDGELLSDRLAESGATVMQATPATWRMLLDARWSGRLRMILCGGETFPPGLVAPLLERAQQVWNMFGPTETTVWSTAGRVEPGAHANVSIGRPIANTRTIVVDDAGRLAPRGVAGELWIGGAGVARGYHDRPELTALRFVADPVDGRRAYRTGDLARWRADGALEHLGRGDDQVKVNGYRIELAEVETVLAAHPQVRQAVAAVQRTSDGESRLVGYVVMQGKENLISSEIRRFVGRSCPTTWCPASSCRWTPCRSRRTARWTGPRCRIRWRSRRSASTSRPRRPRRSRSRRRGRPCWAASASACTTISSSSAGTRSSRSARLRSSRKRSGCASIRGACSSRRSSRWWNRPSSAA